MASSNETIETLFTHRQGFAIDDGMLTTVFLFVLILANLILTIHFYLSWRSRRKYLLLPRGIKRKQGASQRLQADPQREKDPIYADIRESYFSDTHGEMYACIDTKPGGKNTYRRLKDKFTWRGRNRDKTKTLTMLFDMHSQDVNKTVRRLESEEITTE
uniref:Uncharacterized protein n=1 Tax=Magallana gigas TaxID=29159 RepID=A0A8W8MXU3_MAGGI|nr:uncharacterized protein LOC105341382 isoform X1 [Crassostrea gigas]